jgi:YgiT-type zinc finger domain-containing protein
MKRKSYNYGECHVCGGTMSERLVKQEFWFKDQLIVIDELPAGVCDQCGERIVNAEVSRQLEILLRTPQRVANAPVLLVPVIRFATPMKA